MVDKDESAGIPQSGAVSGAGEISVLLLWTVLCHSSGVLYSTSVIQILACFKIVSRKKTARHIANACQMGQWQLLHVQSQ